MTPETRKYRRVWLMHPGRYVINPECEHRLRPRKDGALFAVCRKRRTVYQWKPPGTGVVPAAAIYRAIELVHTIQGTPCES